ncbi:FAD-dependent monooxygenase [Aureimonas frigidaquae]|uniref:Monooxygenase FAD-binding n=1 Tax=Aureimonas frigidaquae TaxID=424757 RepID=A0A0P0Z3K2_9HYPH|nr:FAD-dependent monooxygenase [Aureimonas frigidaquae]BAT28614.1 monooxygenase FAD-binding [Aureimonas frigidaquae]
MAGDILVVGAGPVGLSLALGLARHGVACRIIDRLVEPLPYCRAIGITPRTLEVAEAMGFARDMVDAGLWLTGMRSVVQGYPAQDRLAPNLGLPYAELGLPQYETERILTSHLEAHGVRVERGLTLTALNQDSDGVDAVLDGPQGGAARFSYVVGCDGAHSAVRKLAGIGFEGDAFPWPFMLGDVRIDWDLPYGHALRALRLHEDAPPDMFIAIPLPERGRYRVSMMAPEALVGSGGSDHGIQAEMKGPSLQDLQAIADDLLPGKPPLSDLRWSSIFKISMRLASRYRQGRLFLAGDAAHIHPPTGGQGMNTGIQDAFNLAWKLAAAVTGRAAPALLDSYEAERRPVGADVVARTRAASEGYGREGGHKPDPLVDAQIRVQYRESPIVMHGNAPLQEDRLGAGDRAPDANGLRRRGLGFPLHLFELLSDTQHTLLIQPGPDAATTPEALAGDVETLRAAAGGRLGAVVILPAGAQAVESGPDLLQIVDAEGSFAAAYGAGVWLVRPDGYLGWCADGLGEPGLRAYFETIFAPSAVPDSAQSTAAVA